MVVMYKCARCSYETNKKSNINNHFNRKRVCANVNNIELTDEIKQTILDNRIYHPPAPVQAPTTINNTFNIYNTISKLDPEFKIDKLMEHLNRNMLPLEENQHFAYLRNSMLSLKNKETPHNRAKCKYIDDLFKEIIEFLQSFFDEDNPDNNIYDCFIKGNMFHTFDGCDWGKNTVPGGLRDFIKTMKTMIFDAYEVCLIRQMKIWQKRAKAKESLKEYYMFIQSFDNKATFLESRNCDNKLLYNKNDPEYNFEPEFEMIDELYKLWTEVESEMKDYKKSSNKQTLKHIVTSHSDKTFRNLDKHVIEKVSGNTDFQQQLIRF